MPIGHGRKRHNDTPEYRECWFCKEWKPKSDFPSHITKPSICKQCRKQGVK